MKTLVFICASLTIAAIASAQASFLDNSKLISYSKLCKSCSVSSITSVGFGLPSKMAIAPVATGTVAAIAEISGEYVVIVKHAADVFVTYFHLESTTVKRGDTVTPQTILGYPAWDEANGKWVVEVQYDTKEASLIASKVPAALQALRCGTPL